MFSGAGSKDPCAEKLWEKVEDLPEEEAVHEAFLAYCQESRQLDLAAHRYQAFLYKKPESRLGTAYRDRIILLAQFNPRPARRPRHSPRRFSGLKTALVLGLIALLWGLVMIPMILER
ncbi:MAG: hypothetical protein K9M82_09530 [Deltaproteobacteria bacterium]|nr:hypothetical protein [Deltaproteobacteria bacterium]